MEAKGFIESGYKGLVLAGVGNGNCSKDMMSMFGKIPIVRASRIPFGDVTSNGEIDDKKYGTTASYGLTPQQSRILLMLLLSQGSSTKQIHDCFSKFSSNGF